MSGETNSRLTPVWWWGGLLLVVIAVLFARFRLIELPLERDEGEYAYGAQLLLHGGRLYDDLHTMKWPGLYAAYALIFSIGGETVAAIHGGLVVVNVLTAIGVFLLSRLFLDRTSACVAAVSFLVLSVLPVMHGIITNAEHFAVLFPVFGLWCLVHSLRERQWFGILVAGVLIGLGAVMKQHAHAFVALGGVLTLLLPRPISIRTGLTNLGQSVAYVAGVLSAWGAMCLAVWQRGDWDQFIIWTVQYPRDYTRQVGWSEALANFQFAGLSILKVTWPLLLLALLGLASFARQKKWEDCCVVIGFFVASLLSLCPGFYFREHYFLLAVPAIAILCGKGVECLFNAVSRNCSRPCGTWGGRLARIGVLALLCIPLVAQGRLLFIERTDLVSRTLFGPNPFVESPRIAAFLKERMSEDDRMVIFGSEPQIAFYAQRRLATGDIYMYPMTEIHPLAKPLQVEMIRKVNESRPRFALFVSAPTAWLTRAQTEPLLINWMPTFLKDYHLVGLVETVSMIESKYDFAADGELLQRSISRIPSGVPYVAIFCRKDSL